MGGVYVLGHAEGTLIEGNVVAHVAAYHVYAWGIYLDEGASHVVVRRNLVHHTLSAGLHQHYGFNNSVTENVFACAGGADGDLALSIGEPHASFSFTGNVVLRCPPHVAPPKTSAAAAVTATETMATSDPAGASTAVDEEEAASSSCVRGADEPAVFPVAPAWLLWWKGEGDAQPNVTFARNSYASLRPEETREGTAPPWLHLIKRGRTLRLWQAKHRQDPASEWRPAARLFRDAARCDFRPPLLPSDDAHGGAAGDEASGDIIEASGDLIEASGDLVGAAPPTLDAEDRSEDNGGSLLAAPVVSTFVEPPMAVGQPAGGGSGGCGTAAAAGFATPRPEPLAPPALPDGAQLPPVEWVTLRVPGGEELLARHRAQVHAQELQVEQQQRMLHMIRESGRQRPLPCWAEPLDGVRGHYLPGCTPDGCAEHGSLAGAVAVCEALGGASCGGVTAIEARGSYQTRAGGRLRRGPADETSWVLTPCAPPSSPGLYSGGGPEDVCAACAALVSATTRHLGSRRRSEAEVLSAIDSACGVDVLGAASSRRLRTCETLRETHADELEHALRTAERGEAPHDVCARALPEMCAE